MFIAWGEGGRGVQGGVLGSPHPTHPIRGIFHYLSDTDILASIGLRITIPLAFLCYREGRGREGKGKGGGRGEERERRRGRERGIGKRMERNRGGGGRGMRERGREGKGGKERERA